MNIRKATPQDLEEICCIANATKLDYKHPQAQGFLTYVLSPEEYLLRIQYSDFFYVAQQDDRIVGFLMCYDNETLKDLMQKGKLDHEDKLVKTISLTQGPYIYGDQISVQPDTNAFGVGTALMETLFYDMKQKDISSMYVGILHQPVMNHTSKKFCERIGFSLQQTVRNSDSHLWGIYKIQI